MSFDIAKARALCEEPLTREIRIQKCILLPEALDEIERLRKALADRAIMLPRCPDCGAYVGPQQP